MGNGRRSLNSRSLGGVLMRQARAAFAQSAEAAGSDDPLREGSLAMAEVLAGLPHSRQALPARADRAAAAVAPGLGATP